MVALVVMKYKCEVCNQISESSELPKVCSYCGSPQTFLKVLDSPGKCFEELSGPIPIPQDNPGIERIIEKCIKCGRCSTICQEQVGIKYPKSYNNPICLSCGQCILNCPVGALVPKYSYKKVLDYLNDTEKTVVAFTSPAVRVALGEEFQSPIANVEKKMITALKRLGFDFVLDTTFGADLTIMEEASELLERLKSNKNLPQFTSCCPAWVRYVEIYHPELLPNLSTCKSPIGMQGAMIKSYFCEMHNIPRENIIAVAVTPCTAKKSEIILPNSNDTDYVITTSELAMMIRESNLDFNSLPDSDFDSLMSRGSGGGVIFGASGGVTESAVRTAYYLATGKNPSEKLLNFTAVRGYNNMKEATVTISDKKLRLLVAHGCKNIEPLLEKIVKEGVCDYDFIEVMNCPGGCIGGGGQPLGVVSKQQELIQKRMTGLYSEDTEISIHASYENRDIIDIYKSYLERPLSPKAEKLLHTAYVNRSDILEEKSS